MSYANILIPYDNTEHSQHAMAAAAEFVQDNPQAKVHALTIVDPDMNPMDFDVAGFSGMTGAAGPTPEDVEIADDLAENTEKAAHAALKAATAKFLPGVDVKLEVIDHEHTADVIAQYVADNGIDLVVMGRRGKTGIHGLLGSIAVSVQKKVDVPVLTVK